MRKLVLALSYRSRRRNPGALPNTGHSFPGPVSFNAACAVLEREAMLLTLMLMDFLGGGGSILGVLR